jgi:hypothetical protein
VVEAELRSLRESIDRERALGKDEDPSLSRARARLDELELQEQEVLNTHVEGSRAVAKIRHEIGLVREYLAAKEQGAAREQTRRLEVLRARQGELETSGRSQRRAQLCRAGAPGNPELERERDVVARRLDAYRARARERDARLDVDQHDVAVSVRARGRPPTVTSIPAERAIVAWALTGAAPPLAGAFLADWLGGRRRAPAVWTRARRRRGWRIGGAAANQTAEADGGRWSAALARRRGKLLPSPRQRPHGA